MNINDQINFRFDNDANSIAYGFVERVYTKKVRGLEVKQSDLPCVMVRCEDQHRYIVPMAWVVA